MTPSTKKKVAIAAGAVVGYSALTYALDVPLRRSWAAKAARAYADRRGLPLLNVGAGTGRTALFGSTLYGDVNIDLAGRRAYPDQPMTPVAHRTFAAAGVVSYGDAHSLPEFHEGAFGAVLASHILEHLPDPDRAVAEWLRLVGGDPAALFIVTPQWWAPHTWFHGGHRWYFSDGRGGGRRWQLRAAPGLTSRMTSLRGL